VNNLGIYDPFAERPPTDGELWKAAEIERLEALRTAVNERALAGESEAIASWLKIGERIGALHNVNER
jgi:hypothetical protein